jgi:gamma-glutamyltranspeptidase/glutathione hydrolase
MAHLIAVRDGIPRLAVGAPGGRRILDTCLQMTLNAVDFGLDIQTACSSPLVDCSAAELLADDRLSADTLRGLRARGHDVTEARVSFSPRQFASPTGVAVDPATGVRTGGADPFGMGIAAGR